MKVIGCLNRVLYARETKGDMNEEERGKERRKKGETGRGLEERGRQYINTE